MGGNRTSDILARLPNLYAAHKPAVVLVLPSINDRKINSTGLATQVTVAAASTTAVDRAGDLR